MGNGRLTYRGNNGKGYVRAKQYYDGVYTHLEIVADRLCAYEDAIPFADLPRAAELHKADLEGRCVVTPCKVVDAIDNLFSHNEIIALWNDKPSDRDHSYLLWRGEAWRLPEKYKDQRILKIKGIIAENISESDTINLQVTPYIVPCAEAVAALAGGDGDD